MNSIGKKIIELRKEKGLTQEDLADLAKVNIRTIQRIENNENIPRGNTLTLISNALEINEQDILPLGSKQNNFPKTGEKIIHYVFLLMLNLCLMLIVGHLTIDVDANMNSRIACALLSFFIPFFLVIVSPKMSRLERFLKFGTGYITYMIIAVIIIGLPHSFASGLIPFSIFSCLFLYYGNEIRQMTKV